MRRSARAAGELRQCVGCCHRGQPRVLAQKGSLFVTRPTLAGYADTPERLQAMADELFEMIGSGKVKVEIGQRYALGDAAEAQRKLAAGKPPDRPFCCPEHGGGRRCRAAAPPSICRVRPDESPRHCAGHG